MNWLKLLVVMVAMVGCPAVSTVLHNENTAKVHVAELKGTIVDLSAFDSSVVTDDPDDDFDSYLPPQALTLAATAYRGTFCYQGYDARANHPHYCIRAPPALS